MKMPLTYIRSSQGTPLLYLDGFIYEKDKETEKTYWKCIKYKTYSCGGRVHSKDDEIVFDNNGHNHLEDSVEAEVRRIRCEVKKRAIENASENTNLVIANVTAGISDAVADALPSYERLKRLACRARSKIYPRRRLLQMMSDNEIQCPLCYKKFMQSAIEEHVRKCLFLHESSVFTSTNPPKRFKEEHAKSPQVKRIKPEPKSDNVVRMDISTPSNKQSDVMPSGSSESQASNDIASLTKHVPLAERMRPVSLETYVGQSHVLDSDSILYQLLCKKAIPNMILWGPPGCGKTSLANVIANICKQGTRSKTRFVKLSAAMSGVAEVKQCIQTASNDLKFGRKTIIFMDEIHRFNKLQQDIFLSHIESGTITLIGATTENPSFSLNSALLSRCRVVVLEKLSVSDIVGILKKAVVSMSGWIHGIVNVEISSLHEYKQENDSIDGQFWIDEATIQWLAETCDGDARIALGGLELAVQSKLPSVEDPGEDIVMIVLEDVKESLKKSHMLYDRKGDQHYDMISALHKSVRAGDDNAAVYWLARMIGGGEDPVYIARRLVRMASEDIGLADPHALGIAVHTMHACKMIGMPEADVILTQCVTYLARAPKSRSMEDALRAAQKIVKEQKGSQPGVPLHLRNASTKLMSDLGYGEDYNMLPKEISGFNYMPDGLEDLNFFL